MRKMLLPVFTDRVIVTALEGWILILHCFLLSGCMRLKLFKSDVTKQPKCRELQSPMYFLSPRVKKITVSIPMAQYQWQTNQHGRAAPGAEELSSHSRVAWLSCRTRAWCQKPAVVTEHEGKGAARALDAGAFKARLLVDVSWVFAAILVLVVAWGKCL